MAVARTVPARKHAALPAPSPSVVLRRLVDGYQISQALHVVATLGLADLLTDGPRTSHDLAAHVDAHAPSLHRVLRALASVGVFQEHVDGAFSLTPVGDCLRADAPEPLGAWAAFVGGSTHWTAWAHLLETVRTGEIAFVRAHGVSAWEYRARDPRENALFDRAMVALSRRASRSILEAHDFGRYTTLVDVGGGRGALLAAVLAQYPTLHAILFDLPHVVAESAPVLDAAGVADRCRVIGGSFFDGVPPSGDGYILKTVLHDWDDEQARKILNRCREAIGPEGVLLVIERDPDSDGAASDARFADVQMMVGNGGRIRAADEHATLLESAGFRFASATPTRIGLTIIEAAPI